MKNFIKHIEEVVNFNKRDLSYDIIYRISISVLNREDGWALVVVISNGIEIYIKVILQILDEV